MGPRTLRCFLDMFVSYTAYKPQVSPAKTFSLYLRNNAYDWCKCLPAADKENFESVKEKLLKRFVERGSGDAARLFGVQQQDNQTFRAYLVKMKVKANKCKLDNSLVFQAVMSGLKLNIRTMVKM